MRIYSICLAFFTCIAATVPAVAACDGYSLSGEAEPKFDKGSIIAISATGVSSVVGSSPTGIATAMKSASLKARGALVRYMSQDVSSEQLVESMSSSETVSQNGQELEKQQAAERTAEVIRSQAENILKGATNVSECYDAERKLTFVKVGVSESLMQALGNFGKGQHAAQSSTSSSDGDANGSFERKSPNAGLFE